MHYFCVQFVILIFVHYHFVLFLFVTFLHYFCALFFCITFFRYFDHLFNFEMFDFFSFNFMFVNTKLNSFLKKINKSFDSKNNNIFFEQFVNQIKRQFISQNVRFVIFAFKTSSFRIIIFQIYENYSNLCLINNDNYVL